MDIKRILCPIDLSDASTHAIDIGQPTTEILNRAASLPADMIVMGTHGATGFERLALGDDGGMTQEEVLFPSAPGLGEACGPRVRS